VEIRIPDRKKEETAVAGREGIPHTHVVLVSVEVIGVCTPINNSEVLLADDYKYSGRA
jgi:hypothetical protein